MRAIRRSICILCLCLNIIQGIIVTTDNGKLLGVKLWSRNGTPFFAYFGIPYAKPPTGDLRFQPPQDPDSWDGVKNEFTPKPKCLQYDRFYTSQGIGGSEDCLYLNVFTPIVNSESNLPVMVCIHGGAFFRGESEDCSPYYFMDQKVVMVSFNYRLGILGFLSTADSALPGNYGIKDQVAALRWVKKNIKNFGGDPNCVTIFGQSAGGASVHLHMYSPLSKGLFHRAISQSGSATAPWAVAAPAMARNKTFTLAQLTGCPLVPVQDLVLCLKKIPGEELIANFPKFFMWHYVPMISFSVVVEPEMEGAFLTKKPQFGEELHQVPWITGITSGEGGFAVAEFLSHGGRGIAEFNKDYTRLMPLLFFFDFTIEEKFHDDISEIIRKEYFQDREINSESLIDLRNMITDGAFAHDIIKSAINYNGKRYFYYYDHMNDRSFNEIWGSSNMLKFLGVTHGDDLISLFLQNWIFPQPLNGKDIMLSIKLVKYWATFARAGDPNEERVFQVTWDPVISNNLQDLNYLYIGEAANEMRNSVLLEKYSFWENLPLNNTADKYNPTLAFEQHSTQDTSSQFPQQHHNEL